MRLIIPLSILILHHICTVVCLNSFVPTPLCGAAASASGDWPDSRDILYDALSRRPSDPDYLARYATMLRIKGDTSVMMHIPDP